MSRGGETWRAARVNNYTGRVGVNVETTYDKLPLSEMQSLGIFNILRATLSLSLSLSLCVCVCVCVCVWGGGGG